MKYLLIGDLHFGKSNDSQIFQQYAIKLCNFIFETAKSRNITTIIQVGDIVDRRKYINFSTAHILRNYFVQPILEMDMKAIVTVGNHDAYYRNTNKVNSLNILMNYDNFDIYDEYPTEKLLDNGKSLHLFVPWINSDNKEISYDRIKKSRADICIGHLELNGFEIDSGDICQYGHEPSMFNHFQKTFSGHFHQPSQKGNIQFIGASSALTWADYKKPRGFYIFDTDTYETEFIENPFCPFMRVSYDDNEVGLEDILKYDYSIFENKIIKVAVKKKNNPYNFDQFIELAEQAGAYKIVVVEEQIDIGNGPEISIHDIDDTKQIMTKYIDDMALSNSLKFKVNNVLANLHTEAVNLTGI